MINRRDFCAVVSTLPLLNFKFDNDQFLYYTDPIIKTVSEPGIHLIIGPNKSGKTIFGKYLKSKNEDIGLIDCVDTNNAHLDYRDYCAINRIAMKNKIPFLMEVKESVTIGAKYLALSIYTLRKSIFQKDCIDVMCTKNIHASTGGINTFDTRTLFELGKNAKFNDFRSGKQTLLRESYNKST